MSSTNRGGKRSPADFYSTPPYCVLRILEDPYAQEQLPAGRWLEPGAGDGAIIKATKLVRSDIEWTALELREECKPPLVEAVGSTGTVLIEDYLTPPADSALIANFAVSMGNPPYRLAQEFIIRSLEVSLTVCLLLRVNFLASAKRNSFMRKMMPDCYILPNRPSFSGQGTDSPEYAWFIWSGERNRTTGRLRVLNTTSIVVRNEAKDKLVPKTRRRKLKQLPLPIPEAPDESEISVIDQSPNTSR